MPTSATPPSFNPVSHEVILLRIDAVQRQSEENAKALRAVETRLAQGSTDFALLQQAITALSADVKTLSEAVSCLVANENQREGREGVWSAISRSPFAAWLSAAAAGVAAAVGWARHGP